MLKFDAINQYLSYTGLFFVLPLTKTVKAGSAKGEINDQDRKTCDSF